MAGDEWEQLKTEAADRHSTAMRLNRVPDEGDAAAPQGALEVDQQELAAVGDAAYRLFGDLGDLGNHGRDAWSAGQEAGRDLSTQGFSLGGALDHVQER